MALIDTVEPTMLKEEAKQEPIANRVRETPQSEARRPQDPPSVPHIPAVEESLVNFGWEVIVDSKPAIPYIIRGDKQYVAARLISTLLHSDYRKILSSPTLKCGYESVKLVKMSQGEADVLNEINILHCDQHLVGDFSFKKHDELISLIDVKKSMIFFQACLNVLLFRQIDNSMFGFISISGQEVPFVWHNGRKMLPLFFFDGLNEYLTANSLEITDLWSKASLKFCCLVLNIRKYYYEQKHFKVIDLECVKTLLAEDTTFDDFWPKTVNEDLLTPKVIAYGASSTSNSYNRASSNITDNRPCRTVNASTYAPTRQVPSSSYSDVHRQRPDKATNNKIRSTHKSIGRYKKPVKIAPAAGTIYSNNRRPIASSGNQSLSTYHSSLPPDLHFANSNTMNQEVPNLNANFSLPFSSPAGSLSPELPFLRQNPYPGTNYSGIPPPNATPINHMFISQHVFQANQINWSQQSVGAPSQNLEQYSLQSQYITISTGNKEQIVQFINDENRLQYWKGDFQKELQQFCNKFHRLIEKSISDNTIEQRTDELTLMFMLDQQLTLEEQRFISPVVTKIFRELCHNMKQINSSNNYASYSNNNYYPTMSQSSRFR